MLNSDRKAYENSVMTCDYGSFFQSSLFGEFQEKIPYRGKSWTLFVKDKSSCLVIKQKLPLNYCRLWIPYGPLGFDEELFKKIQRIAEEEKAIFARIEPPMDWNENYTKKLKKDWRIVPTNTRFTPEHSLVVDLDQDESDILTAMKPKGRYNINVAKKNGIVILRYDRFSEIPAHDFNDFYEILNQTSSRDGFGIHPKEFYKNLLIVFGEKKMISLFLAYDASRKVIAGIIVVYYKDVATYYYGASDYKHRHLMAPYLLQWEAMHEARRRGIRRYDFLGIAPAEAANHPWAGVTEFKKKFGGQEIVYPKAFDIIYKPFLHKIYCYFLFFLTASISISRSILSAIKVAFR